MNEIKVTKPLNLKDKISTEYGLLTGKKWMEIEITRLDRIVFVIERNKKMVDWFNTRLDCEYYLKSFNNINHEDYKIIPKRLVHTLMESKTKGMAHITASFLPVDS